jgi:hypothetical protein
MSDPDAADLDFANGSEGDAVFITDASAEGEAIASALRARGFVVVDVPIGLLESRIVGETPRVLIVDVDQAGAFEAVERVRELTGGATAELICIGDPGRAGELGAPRNSGRSFERPVDLDRIVDEVALVAEPGRRDHQARGTTPPPSYAPRRETAPPVALEGEPGALSEYPRAGDPLDVASILPGGDEASGLPKVLPTQLSPELEQLLFAAERKVLGHVHPSSVPSPDEEVDLILSQEVLATLDEPLEPEDDDAGTGSGLGTPLHGAFGTQPRSATSTLGLYEMAARSAGASADAHTDAAFETAGMPQTSAPTAALDFAFGEASGRTRTPDDAPATELFDANAGPVRARSHVTPQPAAIETSSADWAPVGTRPGVPLGGTPPPPTPRTPVPTPSAGWARAHASQAGSVPPIALDAVVRHRLPIPAVLGEGDAVRALASAIGARASGSLAYGMPAGVRRVVLHDGDIVTAGSGVADETLLSFLAARGDIERDVVARLAGKLPPFGRHAGAALIAHGHLSQDDLWPVLRAHAEWVIGRTLLDDQGTCELEDEPPGRLKAEPSVFGGATGAEVLVETVRRVVLPEVALRRMGGVGARLHEGNRMSLLSECALRPDEEELVRGSAGRTVGELIQAGAEPELLDVLYALVALEVLVAHAPPSSREESRGRLEDPLDEEALRQRVRARLALVEDGDYFSVLGIARYATSYEIRRAFLDLRRAFEPSRLLTAATADLADDVRTIIEVLEEAYEILREPQRRERYRRAIEAGPPSQSAR